MATIYIDPTRPANGAGTFADPKNTFVGISWTVDTTYAIKGGTTLNEKVTVGGAVPSLWETRKILCSYDPITGDLIKDHGSVKATIRGTTDLCLATYLKPYIEVCGLAIDMSGVTNAGIFTTVDNVRIHHCDIFTGNDVAPGNRSAINIADTFVTGTDLQIYSNRIYNAYRGVSMLANQPTLAYDNIHVYDNHIWNLSESSVRITTESGAYVGTAHFTSLHIHDNDIHDCGGPLQFRCGYADSVTLPNAFSTDVYFYGNHIRRCGTPAGPNGLHGGISVSGVAYPGRIYGNHVHHVYVTGAGIQTAKNSGIFIEDNRVHDIYSGTPLHSFQDGLPIDANGIFIDNKSDAVTARYNLVFNLAGTGQENSGVAFSFWDCTNGIFTANIAHNVRIGLSFGAGTETGNKHRENTIIDAEIGLYQVGGETGIYHALTSNLFIRCGIDGIVAAGSSHLCTYNYSYDTPLSADSISTAMTSDPALRSDFTPTNPAYGSSGSSPALRKDFYRRVRGPVAGAGTYPGAVHMPLSAKSRTRDTPVAPAKVPVLGE